MSLDGMSIESDSLAIHEHPAEGHEHHDDQNSNHRSQTPDLRPGKSNAGQQQSYDADSSRPSVIETANKAPQVIECT